MIFDGIVFLLVLVAFIRGWSKGLLWAICSVVAVLVALLVAMKLADTFSNYLFQQNLLQSKYTFLASFVLLFFGSLFLFRMLVKLLEGILDKLFLGWLNHALGAVLYVAMVVLTISTFVWLSEQTNLLSEEIKQKSVSISYLRPIAPKSFAFLGHALPAWKQGWQRGAK